MFAIRVRNQPAGIYVAGFNTEHQTVMFSHVRSNAKTFRTERMAAKWAAKYSDAGYGLRTGSWFVSPISQ